MKAVHDERNLIFSRVKLKVDTPRYQAYYQAHPEVKELDDSLRDGEFFDGLKINQEDKERFFPLFNRNRDILKGLYDALKSTPLGKRQAIESSFKENIKAITKHYGALDVGIVKLKSSHYYSHKRGLSTDFSEDVYGEKIIQQYTHAIVYLIGMDLSYINRAPYFETWIETENAYLNMAYTGSRLAIYLKQLGYKSIFQSEAYYLTPLVPLAYDAGLGEIGMGNFLVHPKYGNKVRIGAVLTTLSLLPDQPIDFNLQAFCKRCALCLINCPSQSISPHQRVVNDRVHYKFNDQTCYQLWKRVGTDCALCVQSCPFTQGISESKVKEFKENPDAIDQFLDEYIKKQGRRPQTKNKLALLRRG